MKIMKLIYLSSIYSPSPFVTPKLWLSSITPCPLNVSSCSHVSFHQHLVSIPHFPQSYPFLLKFDPGVKAPDLPQEAFLILPISSFSSCNHHALPVLCAPLSTNFRPEAPAGSACRAEPSPCFPLTEQRTLS